MGPLSALIRIANAISGQITSFRLVMTEPWTLSEVITGKSGCERGQKGGGGGAGVERGQKRERREGDGVGWQSILIWSQKRGRGTDRYSHECVCESRLNWQRRQPSSRQVNVTQIEGEEGLSLSLCTQVLSLSERQISTDSRSTFLTTKTLRQGGQGELQ